METIYARWSKTPIVHMCQLSKYLWGPTRQPFLDLKLQNLKRLYIKMLKTHKSQWVWNTPVCQDLVLLFPYMVTERNKRDCTCLLAAGANVSPNRERYGNLPTSELVWMWLRGIERRTCCTETIDACHSKHMSAYDCTCIVPVLFVSANVCVAETCSV